MPHTLEAKLTRKPKSKIQIEITRENFEAFCDAIGLYRTPFLEALDSSERDHRAGRVTKREGMESLLQIRKKI